MVEYTVVLLPLPADVAFDKTPYTWNSERPIPAVELARSSIVKTMLDVRTGDGRLIEVALPSL